MLLSELEFTRRGEWLCCEKRLPPGVTVNRANSDSCLASDGSGSYQPGQYYIASRRGKHSQDWRRLDELEAQCVLNYVLGVGGDDAAG